MGLQKPSSPIMAHPAAHFIHSCFTDDAALGRLTSYSQLLMRSWDWPLAELEMAMRSWDWHLAQLETTCAKHLDCDWETQRGLQRGLRRDL